MSELSSIQSLPLVSAIITVHQNDDDQFFLEALKSIVEQTYANLEILVVADGPIDSKFKSHISEMKLYAQQIKEDHVLLDFKRDFGLLLRPKSEGPGKARNDGISKVTGEYIVIMDSDDISAPDRIFSQYNYLKKYDLDLISSNYIRIDKFGNRKGVKIMPLMHDEVKAMCPFLCPINNPAVFAKRTLLIHNKYEESLRFGEDYNLWIRLLKNGHRLGNHPDFLIFYRENENFYNRRRGLSRGVSDFKNKIRAITLAAPVKWPLVLTFALLTLLARISPIWIVELAYKIRNLLKYRSKQISELKTSFRSETSE